VRVAETLGLPPGAAGVFGLCVGYPAEGAEGEVKPRLAQSVVLHEDRYDATGERAGRAAYDVAMSDFSQRNEMAADTWTARVIARIGTIRALRGRDMLAAALQRLGLPLR
jgi:hypothetical protein